MVGKVSNSRHRRVTVRLHTVAERLVLALFALFVALPFLNVFAYANPIYTTRGEVYIVEYGVPYSKPVRLTLNCLARTIIPPESQSYSKTCLTYRCSISWPVVGWLYLGGSCALEVKTVDGRSFTLDSILGTLGVEDAARFMVEVDIGTRLARVRNSSWYGIKLPGSYTALFWLALPLTMVVEAFVLLITTKYWLQLNQFEAEKILVVGALPSLITLPCVWFVLPKVWGVFGANYGLYVVTAEALVILVEARIYHRLLAVGSKLALLLSFATNIASFAIGLLLF